MGNSLQEQLLKVGLVTEAQLKQAADKTKSKSQKQKAKKTKKANRPRENRAVGPQPTAEVVQAKGPKDQEVAQAKTAPEANADRKALRARVKTLLRRQRLNDPDGDIAHHFVVGKHVRRLYVTDEQQKRLVAGQLTIVVLGERSYLVPTEITQELAGLDLDITIVAANDRREKEDNEAAYGMYQVPDDLRW